MKNNIFYLEIYNPNLESSKLFGFFLNNDGFDIINKNLNNNDWNNILSNIERKFTIHYPLREAKKENSLGYFTYETDFNCVNSLIDLWYNEVKYFIGDTNISNKWFLFPILDFNNDLLFDTYKEELI